MQQECGAARGVGPAREPGERALTWLSAGWVDLELVVVPVVVRLDWRRMKRISLFIGKGKDCSRIAKHFVLEEMSLFENSMRAGGGALSLSLPQSQTFFLPGGSGEASRLQY